MADFTLSAPGTTNNPWTPAGIIVPILTIRSLASGPSGFRAGSTATAIAAHNVNYGPAITTTVTFVQVHASDDIVIGAVVRSGANAGAMICLHIQATTCRLRTLSAAGVFSNISTLTNNPATWLAGDVWSISITITGGTATITASQNGTPITFNANTTTTFTGEASLAAGFGYVPTNNNTTYLSQFTGTGVAGVPVTGTGAITSSIATAAGTAAEGKTSVTAALTGVSNTASGTGKRGSTATGNPTIRGPSVLATVGALVTGSGAIASSKATAAGTSFRGVTDNPGAIDLLTDTVGTLAGNSIIGVPRTGTGAATGPGTAIAGTGARGWSGTGAITSSIATVNGAAFKARALTGTGALALNAFIVNGVTTFGHAGTGAIVSSKAALAGFVPGASGGLSFPARARNFAHRRAILYAHGRAEKWLK